MIDFETLDPHAEAVFVEVPTSKVIFFQAYIESFEGIATVRTVKVGDSIVCVITTPSMRDHCAAMLESLQKEIPWRQVARPGEIDALII